jgi:hypothetical protein
MLTPAFQEKQRQVERLLDNCRRDLEEQGSANEELSSEMQARTFLPQFIMVFCNFFAAIGAAT